MPRRVDQMMDAFERNERDHLIRLAHQLKGSGGGYGFPILTDAAGKLEECLLELPSNDLGEVETQLQTLVDVCSNMAE